MSGKMIVLGAGASCAAIPNGDKNGKKISAMSGFIEKLGLSDILSEVAIQTDLDNLEDIYMELDNRSKKDTVFWVCSCNRKCYYFSKYIKSEGVTFF
ncbi:hypothetical protein [Alkaliphilus sp. B6464]|uniref:hypothetical protein n=1 Tax=Alkaliphilus sp. B6464 TaxID=2731219 RepID=UPI001BAB2C74|nr:hypothetical protein [Alkaliphilus sp. B6464]QUH20580.1 hypothetical protein HYG84_12320 [Alkaliphilus sp. B6464]